MCEDPHFVDMGTAGLHDWMHDKERCETWRASFSSHSERPTQNDIKDGGLSVHQTKFVTDSLSV